MDNNQQFRCSGDCRNCHPQQRNYCASQHALSNMKVLDMLMGIVMDIKTKIEAMQDNEADIFAPHQEELEETAQEGDGAKKIDSPK